VLRVDETYCGVAGNWTHLYRAVGSTAAIDFLLSGTRDAVAAKCFAQRIAFSDASHPIVDRNPSYPKAISD
jgi:transposase-like protein